MEESGSAGNGVSSRISTMPASGAETAESPAIHPISESPCGRRATVFPINDPRSAVGRVRVAALAGRVVSRFPSNPPLAHGSRERR